MAARAMSTSEECLQAGLSAAENWGVNVTRVLIMKLGHKIYLHSQGSNNLDKIHDNVDERGKIWPHILQSSELASAGSQMPR
jgi:hypothetical protein